MNKQSWLIKSEYSDSPTSNEARTSEEDLAKSFKSFNDGPQGLPGHPYEKRDYEDSSESVEQKSFPPNKNIGDVIKCPKCSKDMKTIKTTCMCFNCGYSSATTNNSYYNPDKTPDIGNTGVNVELFRGDPIEPDGQTGAYIPTTVSGPGY